VRCGAGRGARFVCSGTSGVGVWLRSGSASRSADELVTKWGSLQEADFGRKTEKGLDVRGRGPAFSGLGANGAWATCELDICFSGGPSFNISPKSSGKLLLRKYQKSHSKYVCVDSTCQPL